MIISNKTNDNEKKGDQIKQMKKIKEGWNWKRNYNFINYLK
jgi:hypothetical protein